MAGARLGQESFKNAALETDLWLRGRERARACLPDDINRTKLLKFRRSNKEREAEWEGERLHYAERGRGERRFLR